MPQSVWKATAMMHGFPPNDLGPFPSRDEAKRALEEYVRRELDWYDQPGRSQAILSQGSMLYLAKEVIVHD